MQQGGIRVLELKRAEWKITRVQWKEGRITVVVIVVVIVVVVVLVVLVVVLIVVVVLVYWLHSSDCTGRFSFTDFFLHDFAVTPLDNLYRFSNLCNNFHLIVIWHVRSATALVLRLRLAESDVTGTTIMCVYSLCLWYNHAADLVPLPTTLAFVTKMSEKRKSTSPYATQVENRLKTIGVEEKLGVIRRLEIRLTNRWHMP